MISFLSVGEALKSTALLVGMYIATATASIEPVQLDYVLRVDSADLSGITVELRIRNAPASLVLAAHAHPEYDDKYWRHVENLRAVDSEGRELQIAREDSVLWQVRNQAGEVTVHYRVRFPQEEGLRASWRPFLTPTGGLVGGPHSFLYAVGHEDAAATVTLELPAGWRVASGLAGPPGTRTFRAPDIHTLMESPMLAGSFSEWTFRVRDVPHRVIYWRLPDAAPFDTVAFAGSIQRLAAQALDLFGSAPYREYTFLFQDGAFEGGLEHPNSATLGAPSSTLTRDPYATLAETAHEFVHTWNLMAIKPAEYRKVDYRVQPPVSSLWFSEGLTLFYADLLLRRAGLPTSDSTRIAHLESLIERYLSAPGNAHFSAEDVSRVAYNAGPEALGDYTASSHLQGELIGIALDLRVRDATDGARSMDDVMRLMYTRFTTRGFTGADVQSAVEEVCGCSASDVFDRYVRNAKSIDFNSYLSPLGLRMSVAMSPLDSRGEPLRDLRVWGWEEGGVLRLRVGDPGSIWGRAGLHTGDQLISINGAEVRTWRELRTFLVNFAIGDSAAIVVQRPGGPFETRVTIRGFERPVVRIESAAGASDRQRRLRDAWLAGR